jgi:GTP cyclohydrolase II
MIRAAQAETVRRVVSTRMPTRWGEFQTLGFERDISNGSGRIETGVAIVLGDLTEDAPLLRIHSQCFTGEVLGSLRRKILSLICNSATVQCPVPGGTVSIAFNAEYIA